MRQWESGPWYIKRMKVSVRKVGEKEPSFLGIETLAAQYLCPDGWKTEPKLEELWEFTDSNKAETQKKRLEMKKQAITYRPNDPPLPIFDYVVISQTQFLNRLEKK